MCDKKINKTLNNRIVLSGPTLFLSVQKGALRIFNEDTV